MKVSDLGEFGLIERLAAALAARPGVASGERLAAGIGDDATVWLNGPPASFATIATTDTLVADVHFLPDATPWADVGWKAIAVNVSDIAAMGGEPEFALVTLGLSGSAGVEQMDELYSGVAEACEAYGVVVAGGDIVRAESMFITVALSGRAELDAKGKPFVLRRNAAQAGDAVAVTGCLGGAAGGLRALQDGLAESEPARALIARHRRPQARLAAGSAAIAAGIRCGIDISDGLLQDLGHVCRASALGAVLRSDGLPIDPALADVFEPEQALQFAAAGGEDYELLFTGRRKQIAELTAELTKEGGVPVTIIGEMVDDTEAHVRLLDSAGREVELPDAGWDHLRGAE